MLYLAFNYISQGFVIADAVTAIGLYIAFYYGLTGFACAWYYRKTLRHSQRDLWMQGILPVLGGLMMYAAGAWAIWADWDVATGNSYTSWLMPFWPHWYIGGAFVIALHLGARRADRRDLDQVRQAGLLPEGDPDQGHPDPGARRVIARAMRKAPPSDRQIRGRGFSSD